MINDESEAQQSIQIEAPFHHCQLLRNNSGALEDKDGRTVRFGLGNISKKHADRIKSSDLIGFRTVQITPAMVGQTIAVFTAVEVKRPGWKRNIRDARENAQDAFLDWVKAAGGFSGFATSIADFRRIIGI
jgi:hypothetical protein